MKLNWPKTDDYVDDTFKTNTSIHTGWIIFVDTFIKNFLSIPDQNCTSKEIYYLKE